MSYDDLTWVLWALFGSVIVWRVVHESMKDLHWMQARGLNGQNLRDATEAMWQNGIRLAIQLSLLICGAWRMFLPPADRWWWDVPDKMYASTLAIIISSSLLTYAALRDLRHRRVQMLEMAQRQSGQKQTRSTDALQSPS